MAIKNYSLLSFYQTLVSAAALLIGYLCYLYFPFAIFMYMVALVTAVAAIVYSLLGIGQKNSSYKYLSAAIYIYIIILGIYMFTILNEPVIKG